MSQWSAKVKYLQDNLQQPMNFLKSSAIRDDRQNLKPIWIPTSVGTEIATKSIPLSSFQPLLACSTLTPMYPLF